MKYIFLGLITLFNSYSLVSQNDFGKSQDLGRIVISTYVPNELEGSSDISMKFLANKLDQITTNSGLGGSGSRFIIVPNINIIEKVVTSSYPAMIAIKLNVTFFIGDGIDGIKYSSYNVIIKGVGETESKAYISAIKNIKIEDQSLIFFISNAKKKIIEFYNSKCDFLIKKAQTRASMKYFDEGICELMKVPEVCKECYNKAMETANSIYISKINNDCEVLLVKSKSIWSSGQDINAAKSISKILSNLDPNSSCIVEAQKLMEDVEKRVKSIDRREWNFKLKVYQDEKIKNMEIINSARQIGIAYGLNQPKVVYNFNSIRSWY